MLRAAPRADFFPDRRRRYYVTSLRTAATALLAAFRDRWSIENGWHWPRDTQLREDAHRYQESNGVRIMATLRSLAMNAQSYDIRGLLALVGWREPARTRSSA